jgi:hypothetical protein
MKDTFANILHVSFFIVFTFLSGNRFLPDKLKTCAFKIICVTVNCPKNKNEKTL